jgi:hypothetical protein
MRLRRAFGGLAGENRERLAQSDVSAARQMDEQFGSLYVL